MKISLNFVGDISLTDIYDDVIDKYGSGFPFKSVRSTLNDCTFLMGNLESPLTTTTETFQYKTSLKANPKYIDGLKWAGFDVLNLSNNHILDFKEDGAQDTIKLLDASGIKYFGYGENRENAVRMVTCEKDGCKVGFIGYTDITIDSPFWADNRKSGIAKIEDGTLETEILENRKKVDLLVISLHWGIENFWLPSPKQRALGRKLIDLGANLVIGHHPHVIQGIERWKHGIIAYSLGNFVFSQINWKWQTENGEPRTTIFPLKRRNRESFILEVQINENKVMGYSVIGTYISKNGQLRLAPGVDKNIKHLSELLEMPDYNTFFLRELRKFQYRTKMLGKIFRLTRIYKLRPKHICELKLKLRRRNETSD